MRRWSKSEEARFLCKWVICAVEFGRCSVAQGLLILCSYPCRDKVIRLRAAKRYGKLMREGKIKFNKHEDF